VASRSVETLFEVIEDADASIDRTETLFPANLVVRASA
jgi:hypothetical protein